MMTVTNRVELQGRSRVLFLHFLSNNSRFFGYPRIYMSPVSSIVLSVISKVLALFYIVPVNVNYNSVEEVPDYIQDAIPFFLLMIAMEQCYAFFYHRNKIRLYTLRDFVMSVSLGIVQQFTVLWFKEWLHLPYQHIYEVTTPLRAAIFGPAAPVSSPWKLFLLGFLGCDLAYYWFHRMAHELHGLWFTHSVHHSGERYNLATALRQGAVQPLFSWVFYLPLAAAGLPAPHMLRHLALNTVFQFWVHTETVGRLPLLVELLFNTPSHHRMHHRPPGNCNYAGVLIVWDRLFGTFESELSLRPVEATTTASPASPVAGGFPRALIFGLARPLPLLNPLFANVSHLLRLLEAAALSRSNQSSSFSQFLSLLTGRRVRHPLTVALTWKQLFPDILQQWRLYPDWRTFMGQLFFLPPSLTEAVAVGPAARKETKAETRSEEDKEPFPRKEREFFAGRLARESHFSSPSLAGVGFLLTLGASFALLLLHERLFSQGSAAERGGFVAAAGLCVAALQYISGGV